MCIANLGSSVVIHFAVFDKHDDDGKWARLVRDTLTASWKWANADTVDANHARLVETRQEMCWETWQKPDSESELESESA